MPTLVWSPVKCEAVEVWIDRFKMDILPGNATQFVPFPLSFGEHEWKIVAIAGSASVESETGFFCIEDEPVMKIESESLILRSGWTMQAAEIIGMDGRALSESIMNKDDGYKCSVPATVLSVLVRNGVYPNPYTHLNNMLIPDACDSYNEQYGLLQYSHIPGKSPWSGPYWFCKSFRVPDYLKNLSGVQLILGEINYRAEIWLNGNMLAASDELVGSERVFRLRIEKYLDFEGVNYLAVAIHPLDEPGIPDHEPLTPLADPGRNMGADVTISHNYTKWDAVGWDWQPPIRDRDMGILEEVVLTGIPAVEIKDLYITSKLHLPDISTADLHLTGQLHNRSDSAFAGIVEAEITDESGKICTVSRTFSIRADESYVIDWNASNEVAMTLENPVLWWPHDYGKAHLYRLKVRVKSGNSVVSEKSLNFGIREVESYLDGPNRVIQINGQRIYIAGGNWVIDMMYNWTASRYRQEIMMARESGLNYLRVWGPTGTAPEVFFDEADKQGVLIQQDFLNDFWGTEKNAPGNCPAIGLFEAASRDIIHKLRNHPSLIVWCGGNEGPNPRENLIVNRLLPECDGRDSRYYLTASNGDGFQGGGPYHNILPREYYNNPKIRGLNSEIGPSGVPELESLQKFLDIPGKKWGEGRFPLNGEWAFHDATDRPDPDTRKFSGYDNILRKCYGPPESEDEAGFTDYVRKCQLVNFDAYRAAMEALNCNIWTGTTGFALWKFNSSWPSVTWQLFDWYQQTHSGFYAVKKACRPLHIQYNRDDQSITVVNRRTEQLISVRIEATLLNLNMEAVWKWKQSLNIEADSTAKTEWKVPSYSDLHFLKLRLLSDRSDLLADNFYWLNNDDDFTGFNELKFVELSTESAVLDRRSGKISVMLANRDNTVALSIRVKITDSITGCEVLPSCWSDNYINLLPGESSAVSCTIDLELLPEKAAIEINGFNIAPQKVKL